MAKPQITSKNLEVLSELMLMEELAYKKCANYASALKDPQLQSACRTIAENHRARFSSMFDYLNSHE
ncbi:MAG: hypothetical protein LBS99_05570 [Clostridiales bacterium]|jgi:hypothetical protein|nr:hypothetical protein [Clostridiales bacterium]